MPPLLSIAHLSLTVPSPESRTPVKVLEDISFEVAKGEILGIVGASGAGKTSLARCVMGLEKAALGDIRFRGKQIIPGNWRALRALWQKMQIIWQDPLVYLNPFQKVRDIIKEPLFNFRCGNLSWQDLMVRELMAEVGLDPVLGDRYPHELSGGQCQKVAIARTLALEPELLICDEPLVNLDPPTQVEILQLFRQLHRVSGMSFLFISHDLHLVRLFCSRVMVLQEGRIVEEGETNKIFTAPDHPHTRRLISCLAPLPGFETC